MKRSKFTEEQIAYALRPVERGLPVEGPPAILAKLSQTIGPQLVDLRVDLEAP
jgi:hypothetical protein